MLPGGGGWLKNGNHGLKCILSHLKPFYQMLFFLPPPHPARGGGSCLIIVSTPRPDFAKVMARFGQVGDKAFFFGQVRDQVGKVKD